MVEMIDCPLCDEEIRVDPNIGLNINYTCCMCGELFVA